MSHSILKRPKKSFEGVSTDTAVRSREDHNRETAIYHANIIQQRKDVEAAILTSTEALLDLPSSPSADPNCPSPPDAAFVKRSLRSFQPSDYDDLVEERNVNRLCGYVLCPRQNQTQDTKAKFRILRGGGDGLDGSKIVPTKSLEKWCSIDCAKRALYIKVQLNEEPAWTRAGLWTDDIELLGDYRVYASPMTGHSDLCERVLNLDIGSDQEQIISRIKSLAIERGDMAEPRNLENIKIQDKILEAGRVSVPVTSGEAAADLPPGSVEGYTPRLFTKTTDK